MKNIGKSTLRRACAFTLLVGVTSSAFAGNPTDGTYVASAGPVSIYRSPNGEAQQAILSEIGHARARILVEAYSFTSAPIYSAVSEVASSSEETVAGDS